MTPSTVTPSAMAPAMTPATAVTNTVVWCSIDACDGRHIDGWRRHIDSSNRCDYDRCDDDTIITVVTSVAVIASNGWSHHPYGHCERCYQSFHVRFLPILLAVTLPIAAEFCVSFIVSHVRSRLISVRCFSTPFFNNR